MMILVSYHNIYILLSHSLQHIVLEEWFLNRMLFLSAPYD